MENNTDSALLIESNIYGFDLKQMLWKQQYDQPEHKEILAVLLKLIKVDLVHCEKQELKAYFTEDEIQMLKRLSPIQGIENKEISARWLDVMLTINKKNLKSYIVSAHQAYMDVYSVTKEIGCLVRAIALVKYAKTIFDGQLEEIFEQAKKALFEYTSAYYQQLILIELTSVYGQDKCQVEFNGFLEEKIDLEQAFILSTLKC